MPASDAVGDVDLDNPEPVAGAGFEHGDWTPSDDPTRAAFHGLVFRKPAQWIETQPVTSLREANYSIPGRSGEDAAELAVLWFDSEFAQPIDVHVERLQMQFEPDSEDNPPQPEVQALEADGLPITVIDLFGAYVKPGSAWYSPQTRVVTAIVEAADGQLVLRLTGPDATVEQNLDRFRTMLKSARPVEPGKSDDRSNSPDSAENGRDSAG